MSPETISVDVDDPRLPLIRQVIEELRPVIRADGGDVELAGIDGRRIKVRLSGQCLGCALAAQTLGGIRRRLTAVLNEPVMVVPAA